MRCPKCGSRDDKVIDSRQSREGLSIRGRRECLKCTYRHTTYGEIERAAARTFSRGEALKMVAFKVEFPYLKAETGQLFEFDRGWLREAITRAANDAGYPSWWLTEHVTESIAFYLRLRNDESFIAFNQLSQTVRYVLKVIGYKEIVPHFSPTPPPVSISWFEIAYSAGGGYELAFFEMLTRRL